MNSTSKKRIGAGVALLILGAALAGCRHSTNQSRPSAAQPVLSSTASAAPFQPYLLVQQPPPKPARITHVNQKLYVVRMNGCTYLRDRHNHYYHVGRDAHGDIYPTYYDSTTRTTYPLYYDSDRDRYYRVVKAGDAYYRGYADDPSDRFYECSPGQDTYYTDYDQAPDESRPIVYYGDEPADYSDSSYGRWYEYHPYYGDYHSHSNYHEPDPTWLALVPIVIGAYLILQPHHYHDHDAWYPQQAPVYQQSVYRGGYRHGSGDTYVDVSNAYYRNVNVSGYPVGVNGGLPPVARDEPAVIKRTAMYSRTVAEPGMFSPRRAPGAVTNGPGPSVMPRAGGYAARLPAGGPGRAAVFSHPGIAYRPVASARMPRRTFMARTAAARPATRGVYRRPLVAAGALSVRRGTRPQYLRRAIARAPSPQRPIARATAQAARPQYRRRAMAQWARPQRSVARPAYRPRYVATRAPVAVAGRPAAHRIFAMHRIPQTRVFRGQPSFQARGPADNAHPRPSAQPAGGGGRPTSPPRRAGPTGGYENGKRAHR